MASKSALTIEDHDFIWANYPTMTVTEIAKHLGQHGRTVYEFYYQNDLTPFVKERKKNKRTVPEGMFDVNEKEWI